MPRRPITERVPCAESGCAEASWREHDNQRERAHDWKLRQAHPWRCARHRHPEEVLGVDHPERTHVLVSRKAASSFGGFLDGLYWTPEGDERGGSRSLHGPGFKAFTADFPEGTRLIITARVELPVEDKGDDHE